MGLKIDLKPDERILINGAVIRNWSDRQTRSFIVENKATILRESQFMTEEEAAKSPARRLYYLAMLAMLDGVNEDAHRDAFINSLAEFVGALRHPIAIAAAAEAGEQVRSRQYHQALKGLRHLIEYEANALAGIVPPVEAVAA